MRKSILYLFLIVFFASCKTNEKVAYFQSNPNSVPFDTSAISPVPEPTILTGDVLMITVNSRTPEAALPFNLPLLPSGQNARTYSFSGGHNVSSGVSVQNYLVDNNGFIIFPVLGKIHVAGLSKSQLTEQLHKAIHPEYIKEEPVILIRFGNFRISVLGEVNRPGTYPVDNERISVIEALSMAGDLTVYGQRENVLLIRENGNRREMIRLDLRDPNIVNSPWYYLQQNDALYIEPNQPKARSSNISTAETLSISIVGTLISLTSLLVNILK